MGVSLSRPYGLFLLPWIVTTKNEAGEQLGCSILDKALFCIFPVFFSPYSCFLQRDYWVVGETNVWFHLVCCGGWVSFLLDLWDLFPWVFVFYFPFCYFNFGIHCRLSVSFFGLGFYLFLFFICLPRWVSGGGLPTQYEIISASNQFSFSLLLPLEMNWSDVIWEMRNCGVFFSLSSCNLLLATFIFFWA